MLLPFHKMQACGNDFVIINSFQQTFTLAKKQIQLICDRHFGIGCDQLLLLEPSTKHHIDFIYRIFNSDGNEVMQCGNGARCVAKYAYHYLNLKKNILRFETLDNDILEADMNNPEKPNVLLSFISQKNILGTQSFSISSEQSLYGFLIDIGNPHCVFFTTAIDEINIPVVGKELQNVFSSTNGMNISFVEKISNASLRLRVYERGVGETLACGSAACAAVIAGSSQGSLNNVVNIQCAGGAMQVTWNGVDTPIFLQGEAIAVFEGHYQLSP